MREIIPNKKTGLCHHYETALHGAYYVALYSEDPKKDEILQNYIVVHPILKYTSFCDSPDVDFKIESKDKGIVKIIDQNIEKTNSLAKKHMLTCEDYLKTYIDIENILEGK